MNCLIRKGVQLILVKLNQMASRMTFVDLPGLTTSLQCGPFSIPFSSQNAVLNWNTNHNVLLTINFLFFQCHFFVVILEEASNMKYFE